jgi:DNA sulfur modification protein DndB
MGTVKDLGLVENVGKGSYRKNLLYANKLHREMSTPNSRMNDYLNMGWEIYRPGKNRTRLRRQKPHFEAWEHKVWSIFAKMEFDYVNDVSPDSVPFVIPGIHQIDVFAKLGDTVIIIECKSQAEKSKKSIKGYIHEIQGYRKSVEEYVKNIFGKKTKCGFGIATENYVINSNDLELAKKENITLMDEDSVNYFLDIIKTTGTVSRYQLLSDFFNNQEFDHLRVSLPALKTKIGKHEAYLFTIQPSKLIPISFIAHRAKGEAADVSSFQRLVKGRRLKDIRDYIEGETEGFFPTNILLNIDTNGKGPKYNTLMKNEDVEFVLLTLPASYKSAWVIDGQHRLLAYDESELKDKQNLCVLAFYDMDPSLQANMFVDINNKQRRVPANVIIELNAKLKWSSDKPSEYLQALNARTMLTLATDRNLLLSDLIKLVGEKGTSKPYTGKTIEEIIRVERFFGSQKKGTLEPGPFWVFDPVLERSKDKSLKKLVAFIELIVQKMKQEVDTWNIELTNAEGKYVLTNNGISAILKVVNTMVLETAQRENYEPSNLTAKEIFSQIEPYLTTLNKHFNSCDVKKLQSYRERLGKAGQTNNKWLLLQAVAEVHPEFRPIGLEEKLKDLDSKWAEESAKLAKSIETRIRNTVIHYLKIQEPESDNWFWKGVQQSKIKGEVSQRKAETNKDFELCFNLIQWKNIIETPGYWADFKHTFAQGKDKNSKKNGMKWFNRLNKLRNDTAHPGAIISQEDYQWLLDLEVSNKSKCNDFLETY